MTGSLLNAVVDEECGVYSIKARLEWLLLFDLVCQIKNTYGRYLLGDFNIDVLFFLLVLIDILHILLGVDILQLLVSSNQYFLLPQNSDQPIFLC